MSCWCVLELSEPPSDEAPQLLFKTVFGPRSYTVLLTDLSNIWSETLDLDGIVCRASLQESPIEVSKQDTTQLAILLGNVEKSWHSSKRSIRFLTQTAAGGVVLHTTISLPEPLDSLRWIFDMEKRTPVMLQNELILPLLVSSHIQHERINGLIATISEKDKALTRLLDQYESSNLDLAAAFPSLAALKPGRRNVRREQAAKHVPALRLFHEEKWKQETCELDDSGVSTLGLFQKALTQCTPKVPPRLKADDDHNWWTSIATIPGKSNSLSRRSPAKATVPTSCESETSDSETEDEFETHHNFKLRNIPKKSTQFREETPPSVHTRDNISVAESTEEEDLDAPPRFQSQNRSKIKIQSLSQSHSQTVASARDPSPPPKPSMDDERQKGRSFRIGGIGTRKATTPPQEENLSNGDLADTSTEDETDSMAAPPKTDVKAETTRPTRRPFRIGGRAKISTESPTDRGTAPSTEGEKVEIGTASSSMMPGPQSLSTAEAIATPQIEVPHDETAEEKAERRRRELKRKNENLAKKQGQSKKKKRF